MKDVIRPLPIMGSHSAALAALKVLFLVSSHASPRIKHFDTTAHFTIQKLDCKPNTCRQIKNDGRCIDTVMAKAIDYTGQRVGILTVLHDTGKTKYSRPSKVWLCKCDCGTLKEYSSVELTGTVKSCGCLKQKYMDSFGERNKGRTPATALDVGESTKRSLLTVYKRCAKKRNISFKLTEEQFREIIARPCCYCGSPPSQLYRDRHRPEGDLIYNGIDRQDNHLGYTKDNCVACCKICNRAKDTMGLSDFKEWISRIHTHWVIAEANS